MSADKNTAAIGFEQKIWEAADTLRGNLNAAEYEGVVLGLIFLKYISDKFESKYQELLADDYADAEDKDEYMADNVFFVPPTARWKAISAVAHTPEIGQKIDDAMREIEDNNPRASRASCPKTMPARSSTSADWAMWWTSSRMLKCSRLARRRTSWAVPTNTAS